jgi:hypothetical protein
LRATVVRVWARLCGALLVRVRRAATKARSLREVEHEVEGAARKASRAARAAWDALRRAWCKAEEAATAVGIRVSGDSLVRGECAARLKDVSQELAAIKLELAACTSDPSRAVRRRTAAERFKPTSAHGGAAGRRRTVGRSAAGATSATRDVLRARLRELLSHERASRARAGRRPGVFRRPAVRGRHTALFRELFRPAGRGDPSLDLSDAARRRARRAEREGGAEKEDLGSKLEGMLELLRGMLAQLPQAVASPGVADGLQTAARADVAARTSDSGNVGCGGMPEPIVAACAEGYSARRARGQDFAAASAPSTPRISRHI